MELQDKVVIVTGANSGIGAATARLLDTQGAKLVLTARNREALEKTASELKKAHIVAGDLTDPALPDKVLAEAQSVFGDVDVLINNAGMMIYAPVAEIDIDKMALMIRVNVEATFRMAYAAAKAMVPRKTGFILNTSSQAGYRTTPGIAAYNGSKVAVEFFSDSLRMELAETGVRVAALAPGTVRTALYDDWGDEGKDAAFAGGALDATDIARAILFVLQQPDHMTVARMLALPAKSPY